MNAFDVPWHGSHARSGVFGLQSTDAAPLRRSVDMSGPLHRTFLGLG
jgi:hypothetical protein